VSRKHSCVIEVEVSAGAEGWNEVVNSEMKKALDKLRNAVEALGGQMNVRY